MGIYDPVFSRVTLSTTSLHSAILIFFSNHYYSETIPVTNRIISYFKEASKVCLIIGTILLNQPEAPKLPLLRYPISGPGGEPLRYIPLSPFFVEILQSTSISKSHIPLMEQRLSPAPLNHSTIIFNTPVPGYFSYLLSIVFFAKFSWLHFSSLTGFSKQVLPPWRSFPLNIGLNPSSAAYQPDICLPSLYPYSLSLPFSFMDDWKEPLLPSSPYNPVLESTDGRAMYIADLAAVEMLSNHRDTLQQK